MKYKLVKQVVHDDVLRNSFINLAIKTFDSLLKSGTKKATGPSPIFLMRLLIIIK
jgi:hypothetical protein